MRLSAVLDEERAAAAGRGDGGSGAIRSVSEELQSVSQLLIATRDGRDVATLVRDASNDYKHAEAIKRIDKAVDDWIVRGVRFVDGYDLFRQLQSAELLSTGVQAVDAVLRGGLRQGQVTELVGASPSGKTQICHSTAALTASLGFQVLYVTSNATFSPLRLISLSGKHLQSDPTQFGDKLKHLLANVRVANVVRPNHSPAASDGATVRFMRPIASDTSSSPFAPHRRPSLSRSTTP